MNRCHIAVLLVAGVFCRAPLAHAQQFAYSRTPLGNEESYTIGWRDMSGNPLKVNFRIQRELADADVNFRPIDNQDMVNWVVGQLNRDAQGFLPAVQVQAVAKGADAPQGHYGGDIGFEARGADHDQMVVDVQHLEAQVQPLEGQYFKDRGYLLDTNLSVRPDHARIARLYTPAMKPLAYALENISGGEKRRIINTVLNFLQAIPYDTLDNKQTSLGAGFATPLEMLNINKGDCDTKAAAMAAILRNVYPNLPMVIIYIPNHAFIGIGMNGQGPRDYALRIKGQVYVLAEPVGPAEIPLGDIAPNSAQALRETNYKYVTID